MTTAPSAVRVLITGGPGSGTSTLAAAVAGACGWKHLESDDFQWLDREPPFQNKVDSDTRLANLLGAMNSDNGIVLAGSIIGWGESIEDSFDLIVFRVLDAHIRMTRLVARERQLYGRVDPEFLKWAQAYDTGGRKGRSLSTHKDWLEQRGCRVLRLTGDMDIASQLAEVLSVLESSGLVQPGLAMQSKERERQ